MYLLSFYVPLTHLDSVKKALFATGAGAFGDYHQCAWQVKGEGQFCPKEGSNPTLGRPNELTHVEEYKVEMICDSAHIKKVIKALKKAHPYEQPAYQVIKLARF